MYSKKNDNFSTFYNIVFTFAKVTEKATNARELIFQNKNTLKGAKEMLKSNVLAVQKKIKTKRKLKE